ncbi:MAG TPA: hypothetical protein VFR03_04135 [Thermoanaerobaculia bacterium]|nr:hypothetical protein [Thermoanaerobaculia bacterium]
MLKRLTVGVLAAWAGCAFLVELNRAVAAWDDREHFISAWGWRFESPETGALIRSLDVAVKAIPPGAPVAFTAPDDPPGVEFEAWRWAAYLMPDHDVLSVKDPEAGGVARYAIAYKTEIHNPRAEPMLRLPDGWLYRVKRP